MESAPRRLRPELLPLELGLYVAFFWADEAGLVPLSKTPLLFLVAWASLRLRGLRWRDVGLALPPGWPRLAGLGLAVGVAMWLLEFYVTMPALHRTLGYWPDLTAFNDLVGNVTLLAIYLALNWVLAAFGEETVWRGYALPRAAVGILYLATGRNLVAPIIAHGVGNSIDFTVMYFGLYPGVGS
jgi:membrane protease YdiL (CAAX protease family)